MNTRRVLLIVLIAGLLGLHTVYTRTAALDYSLRTGQLYANVDRLKEQRRELEVNLSILRQPVMAAEKASQYCPQLEPAHPELEAYHLSKDRPRIPVPSLRAMRPPPAPLVNVDGGTIDLAHVNPAPAVSAVPTPAVQPAMPSTPGVSSPAVQTDEDNPPSFEVLDDAPAGDSQPPATGELPASGGGAVGAVTPAAAVIVPVANSGRVPVSGATNVH